MIRTQQLQTVVIGTSLTEASDEVVRAGRDVARAAGARIVLVHAFQAPSAFATYGGGAPYVPDVLMEEAIRAERELVERRLADQIGRLGVRSEELASRRVEYGPPHRVISEAAEAVAADLIVVGSTESAGLAKLFGATADRVVRKATRPVLVVRGRLGLPLERVLLPVDLSPLSAESFRRGLAILDQIAPDPAVQVEALYVMTGYDRGVFTAEGGGDLSEPEAIRELQRFVTDNTFRGRHPVATRIAHGEVEESIRIRSDAWGADLVVLGTHGRGGFERFLLGSVASGVVRRGPTSVLVIPPAAELEEVRPLEDREAAVLAGRH
jgi:nucleotide-binding universal stress UspA family protein